MRSMPFLGENIFSTKGLLVDHTPASVGIDIGFFYCTILSFRKYPFAKTGFLTDREFLRKSYIWVSTWYRSIELLS